MEQKKILHDKIIVLEQAVSSFEKTLSLDSTKFQSIVSDAIDNGKIQKFEYCTELLWKVVKRHLFVMHGIDSKSPKQTVKELYLTGEITENIYEKFLDILDTRNQLSHIYKEEFFKDILNKLPDFLKTMKKIMKIMKGRK